MRCTSSGAAALGVVVTLIMAAPAFAATLGVDGSTLTLDASGDSGETELAIGVEPFDDGVFFSASSSGVQAGAGCALRSDAIACPFEGVSAVAVRGPRAAASTIDLTGLIPREGRTPNVVGSVDAGARSDTIDTVNAIADTISCGPGLDFFRADLRDSVEADCETANQEGGTRARLLPGSDVQARPTRKVGAGDRTHPFGIDFRVTCPRAAPDDSCGGKLDVFVAEPSFPQGTGLVRQPGLRRRARADPASQGPGRLRRGRRPDGGELPRPDPCHPHRGEEARPRPDARAGPLRVVALPARLQRRLDLRL